MIVNITNYQNDNENVIRIFGKVIMNDGKTYKGFAYVTRGQRLQDLLNDDRDFIPFELVKDYLPDTDSIGHIILSKHSISSFQEIKVNK